MLTGENARSDARIERSPRTLPVELLVALRTTLILSVISGLLYPALLWLLAGALTFLPALALGPLADHLMSIRAYP